MPGPAPGAPGKPDAPDAPEPLTALAAPAALDPNPDRQPELPVPAALDYARTVTAWAHAPLPSGIVVRRDLAYGPHRLQRFNVFAPAGASKLPLLVFWHGGGWTNGYRDWVSFMAPAVTDLGLVLVAPSYRLAPEHALPCAVHDALALLTALQTQAPAWGGAPDRLYLAGHSAGGHLAALTALTAHAPLKAPTALPALRSDTGSGTAYAAGLAPGSIRACLPVSGIMDLHDPAPQPGSLEERVYSTVLRGESADQDTLLSPLYWAAGNRVPFVLTHGEFDSERVRRSNRRLLALLQAQGSQASGVVEPGRDHFQTHTALHSAADPWYGRLAALLASHRTR